MLTWDAENRLTKMESQTSAPTTSKRKVEYTYDWQGRLVRRTEYNGSSGSYVITNDLKFLSHGWRCVAELNATNNALVRSYLVGDWGRVSTFDIYLSFSNGVGSALHIRHLT